MQRDDWNARYGAAELVWSAGPNRFLAEEARDLRPGRALDLACGEGRNALWLAEQGWEVTAVDFADVAVDKGRRRAAEIGVDVAWLVEDVRHWDPDRQAFDLVVILYLQLPAGERERVWRAAAAAVAPGGTLLVVGHDSRNLRDGIGGPRSPEVLYTATDVVRAIGDLEIERAGEVLRPVDGGEAIDCLVRARRVS
jgi:2-polyprenyl-3-methyl-5-hydroxy-6-metoxy-1,4-benzoquinol methylase